MTAKRSGCLPLENGSPTTPAVAHTFSYLTVSSPFRNSHLYPWFSRAGGKHIAHKFQSASSFLLSRSPGKAHYQAGSTDILSHCGPAKSCLTPGWKSHHIYCVTMFISRKVKSFILYFVIWLSLDTFYLGFPSNPFFIFLVRSLSFIYWYKIRVFTRQTGVKCKYKRTVF